MVQSTAYRATTADVTESQLSDSGEKRFSGSFLVFSSFKGQQNGMGLIVALGLDMDGMRNSVGVFYSKNYEVRSAIVSRKLKS